MNCKQTVDLFDSYVSNTLNSAEKQALESHLKTCEDCRKQLELYRFYFSDVKIENDFPLPSQLNAKIKYTIQQARAEKEEKETKKIPFWQNKRILSAATACTFLFVAGIWGISNYAKLQDAASSPALEITKPIAQEKFLSEHKPDIQSPTSGMAKDSNQTPTSPAINQETTPKVADTRQIPDHSEEVAAYSNEADTNPVTDTVMEIGKSTRNLTTEDISLSVNWKDTILTKFPHEVISEDIFLVTISKAELESIIGNPIETDETKTQLFIRFTSIEQ